MRDTAQFLKASDAARRLGISAKALRLYEERGLLKPDRTAAGWRVYSPAQIDRASDIAALRALGLSLDHVASLLEGNHPDLLPALDAQQARIEEQIKQLTDTASKIRRLRDDLTDGGPATGRFAKLVRPDESPAAVFDLPWPWGGETFELRNFKRLNYIVGPLGSGKTRLAQAIAQHLPGATFVGLDRVREGNAAIERPLRVERALAGLVESGASQSAALSALLMALEADDAGPLVIDMVEQGLDRGSQRALSKHLRRGGAHGRTLFMLTRSNAILDLDSVTAEESIIFCPANHSPPTVVAAYPGTSGYEGVATCLASPEVRARTQGVVARRAGAA